MATPNYGTLSTLDTLASSQQTIAEIGEDRAFAAVDMALAAHNLIMADMTAGLAEITSDRQRRYGTPAAMKMQELDEFGSPDAQKIGAGSIVGFPLRLYGDGLQWTRKFMQNATGQELAVQTTAMLDADALNNIQLIQKAIFSPINYTSDDKLVDNLIQIPLAVKALANADGAGLPVGPNGEVFNGATHTHYLTCQTPGTLTPADMNAFTGTVSEHFNTGEQCVIIAKSNEQAIRNLTGFTAYYDMRLIQPTTAASAPGVPLDVVNTNNRAIGLYNGAEVWVKPWGISGYLFNWMKGQPRPLCQRVRNLTTNALVLVSDDDDHPLRSRAYERETGFGIYNRVNGAVMDMVHGVFQAPVIA